MTSFYVLVGRKSRRLLLLAAVIVLGCFVTLVVGCKPPVVNKFSNTEVSKLCNATNVECVSIVDFSPNDYRVLPASYLSFLFGGKETKHRSSKLGGVSWPEDGHAPIFIGVFWRTEVGWERPRKSIHAHPIREVVSGSNAKILDYDFDGRRIFAGGVPMPLASPHQNIGSELAFGGVAHDADGFGGGISTDGIRSGLSHDSFER